MGDSAPTPFPGPRPDSARHQTSPQSNGEPRPATPSPPAKPRLVETDSAATPPPPPAKPRAAGAAPPVTFTVLGRPLPAGSKTMLPIVKDGQVVGRRIAESGNREAKAAWRSDVRVAAHHAMHGQRPFTGPVAISVRFYLRRPKSHTGTGRNAGTLKASAPTVPITAPDVLKLARGLEDALTGVVYVDDAQIVDEHLAKRFGEPERTEVTLMPLDIPDADAA